MRACLPDAGVFVQLATSSAQHVTGPVSGVGIGSTC